MKSYQTIIAHNIQQLDELVNAEIDKGYIPFGTMSKISTQNGPKYYIGMILKEVIK